MGRMLRFTLLVGLSALLLAVLGGGTVIANALVDRFSVFLLAFFLTLLMWCFWEVAGRTTEDLRSFASVGLAEGRTDSEYRIGLLVRMLCGAMSIAGIACLLALIVLVVLVATSGNSAVQVRSIPLDDWRQFLGAVVVLSLLTVFFGRIALSGKLGLRKSRKSRAK